MIDERPEGTDPSPGPAPHDLPTAPATTVEVEEVPEAGGVGLNIAAAILPLALGVFALVAGRNLPLGSFADPGPGLWPTILAIALIVLAAVLGVLVKRSTGTERFTPGVLNVLLGAVSLVSFAFIEYVGFELPTLVVAVVWIKLIGKEKWLTTLATAVGAVAAIYLIFIFGLRVSLPHLIPV